MNLRARGVAVVVWAVGWNLRGLAVVIAAVTGRRAVEAAAPLHLPVETVTQQLRTIEVLMGRIRL